MRLNSTEEKIKGKKKRVDLATESKNKTLRTALCGKRREGGERKQKAAKSEVRG